MVKNIDIKQICSSSLCCEPILRKTANGDLLCICQLDGPYEPHIENRVYAFHSSDNGVTWSDSGKIYPEDGQAVYCTEVSVSGNEISAYITVHSGSFLDWKCFVMKSFDNGYKWINAGTPPCLPEYTFIRGRIVAANGNIIIPYQNYPVTREEHDRILREETDKAVFVNTKTEYCESGVILSCDGGKTYERYPACRMDMSDGWIWSEPTIAELSDGTIVMLMRKCRSGWLWRCDSYDGGKSWSECRKTDIPNPSNKPKLIKIDEKRIALLNTPNNYGMAENKSTWGQRYPLELWISDDGMKTWGSKTVLTDFPGSYSYSDGFYEDGHIKFSIEHNRHTALFFDVEL